MLNIIQFSMHFNMITRKSRKENANVGVLVQK